MQDVLNFTDAQKHIFFKDYTDKELAKYIADNVGIMSKTYFYNSPAKYVLAELHRSREHLVSMASIAHHCLNGALPAHLPKEPKRQIPLP